MAKIHFSQTAAFQLAACFLQTVGAALDFDRLQALSTSERAERLLRNLKIRY